MLENIGPGVIRFAAFLLALALLLCLARTHLCGLAAKNLFKNFRRTVLLLCVMVSGLTGLILFFGFAEHSMYNLREATIRNGLGHVQIYQKGYNATGNIDKLEYNIPNYAAIVQLLQNDPYLQDKIKGIAAELEFSGIIANERTSSVFLGKGIEVAKDKVLSTVDDLLAGKRLEQPATQESRKKEPSRLAEVDNMFGPFLIPGLDPPEKVAQNKANQEWKKIWQLKDKSAAENDLPAMEDGLIGSGLATALQAKPGGLLTMMVATKTGTLNAVDTRVRGIIQSFAKEYNNSIVKISLEYAWVLMNRKDVSRIAVLLNETALTQAVYDHLQHLIAEHQLNLELTTWLEVALTYSRTNSFFLAIFFTMGILITIVVLFSIANVMTMSVMERTRQIGTLRALGETRWGILQLFLMEGILIGLVAGTLAVLTGIGIAEMISMGGGIPMPPPPGSSQGFQAFLFITNRPEIWGLAMILAVGSAFASSLIPAHMASRMEITECLRYT